MLRVPGLQRPSLWLVCPAQCVSKYAIGDPLTCDVMPEGGDSPTFILESTIVGEKKQVLNYNVNKTHACIFVDFLKII